MKQNKPIVIGITGGVGSGKSEVLKYLGAKNYCKVFELDKIAHLLQQPGQRCYREIVNLFGETILDDEKCIDRQKLGAIVFEKKELLNKLNEMIHPAVMGYVKEQIGTANKEELVVIEGAILIEAGYELVCQELWFIYVDTDTRMKRVMDARGYSKEKFQSIASQQLADGVFEDKCQVVIHNSDDRESLYKKIEKQLEILLGENK